MTLKLWQQPATPLPFRVRPVRGETTMSYVFRLATANEVVKPITLLRSDRPAVQLAPAPVHAARRFRGQAQRPRAAAAGRLRRNSAAAAAPMPATAGVHRRRRRPRHPAAGNGRGRFPNPQSLHALHRSRGTPPIKVYYGHASVICRRHRRWLGIPTTPGQFDLSTPPRSSPPTDDATGRSDHRKTSNGSTRSSGLPNGSPPAGRA
jgi:hypothetical protein